MSESKLKQLYQSICKVKSVDELSFDEMYMISDIAKLSQSNHLSHVQHEIYKKAAAKNFLLPIIALVNNRTSTAKEISSTEKTIFYASSCNFEILKANFSKAFSANSKAKISSENQMIKFTGLTEKQADNFLTEESYDAEMNFAKIELQKNDKFKLTKIICHETELTGPELLTKASEVEDFNDYFDKDGYWLLPLTSKL